MTCFVSFGNQVSRERTALVTGAVGVGGTALLPQLRRYRLVALAHRGSTAGRRAPPGDPPSRTGRRR